MLNHVAWWTILYLKLLIATAMLNRLVQLYTVTVRFRTIQTMVSTRLKQAVDLWMSQCPCNTCNVQNLYRSITWMSVRRTIKVLHIVLTSVTFTVRSAWFLLMSWYLVGNKASSTIIDLIFVSGSFSPWAIMCDISIKWPVRWISNYTQCFVWDVITHPYTFFNVRLTKPSL